MLAALKVFGVLSFVSAAIFCIHGFTEHEAVAFAIAASCVASGVIFLAIRAVVVLLGEIRDRLTALVKDAHADDTMMASLLMSVGHIEESLRKTEEGDLLLGGNRR